MFGWILTLLSLAAFAQEPRAILTSPEAPRVQGLWKSEAPEKMGNNAYWTQEIQFTLGRWERTVFFSGSYDFKKVVLVYRSEGPFEMRKGADENAPWVLDLKVARRALNLQQKNPALLKSLKIEGCGLPMNAETEIKSGCGLFPALEKCPTEYQVVQSRDGKIRMGIVTSPDVPPVAGSCEESSRPAQAVLTLKRVN